MSVKSEFNPELARVKLNPEQAILQCNCYSTGKRQKVPIPTLSNMWYQTYPYVDVSCNWQGGKTLHQLCTSLTEGALSCRNQGSAASS